MLRLIGYNVFSATKENNMVCFVEPAVGNAVSPACCVTVYAKLTQHPNIDSDGDVHVGSGANVEVFSKQVMNLRSSHHFVISLENLEGFIFIWKALRGGLTDEILIILETAASGSNNH